MSAWNRMAHSLKQKSSPRWWIQPLWFPVQPHLIERNGYYPVKFANKIFNWVKANKCLCQFTFTKLLSNPLRLKFSTDPINSYELTILLILLGKIWFGNLMAKPKQSILQTTTQNLDSKLSFYQSKTNISWDWSATFCNSDSFTKKIPTPCMFSITF